MGLVFKARREGDDRPVALKVLKRQLREPYWAGHKRRVAGA